MARTPSERLASLGVTLPPPPRPAGSYAAVVVDGDRAYVSGQIATRDGSILHPGIVDRDVTLAQAREAARQATLQSLSALVETLGSLDRVRRVLKVAVFVASSPNFTRQHEVGNGATELLIEVFEEAGRPARISMGVASLPLNAPVEVELLVGTG
jgi:enamine deaminase RidA (YjgF/YER057c/UK114 family)